MKKKLRGLLSLWLAVMMVLTVMPMAFAEGEGEPATEVKVNLYNGADALEQGDSPATEEITLVPDDGEYSFVNETIWSSIFPQTDKLLDGWKLWSTVTSGMVDTYDEYEWDATVTADELENAEGGYYKVLEPVWSLCEITEQPTAGNPTVEVTNSTLASYKWYNATVSESDVTLGDAVEGQTTDTLTVTPEADKSYVCEVKWTGKAGDEVTLTSDAVTFEEVTITFDANGGDGEMEDVTIITGEKYELPECEFEAPSDEESFIGWTVAPTVAEEETTEEETEEDIVIYEVGDEITVTESITISAVWEEKVATPVISPSSKTIYNTTAITIECATDGAEIYYTLDGTTPTTSSTRYTRGFAARTNPTVVKAIAVKEGMADSEVATKQYAIMSLGLGGSSGGGGSYGGGGSSSYTVKFDTNGGLTIANQYVKKNGYVEEPKNPTKYGYEFIGWYTDKELTEEYDFDTKVTESFTLYAKWEGEGSAPAETDLFDDVSTDDWFYDNVVYVTENGLMNGMDSNNFGPAIPLNRAMLVTILYRADGSPETSAVTPFADLKYNAYYENAVKWAYSNNIVKGMSDTEFGPEVLITREQLATILYRYADYKGYLDDTAASIGIIAPDSEFISDWALEAMAYCVENKIITGYEDGTIRPKGNTTRAEAATMLQRFIEAN